ncbi:MAG: hypothetical protein F4X45_05705 [Chloroflexi bacterium]|nr:hypothetical protein [Chloroflexota bacterium]
MRRERNSSEGHYTVGIGSCGVGADIADRLFFAGGGDPLPLPVTVHGAILSGRCAARQIIGRINPVAPRTS